MFLYLRLITSFKFAPRMKTGHREDARILLHVAQVDSSVRDLTHSASKRMEKLRILADIVNRNED